MPAERSDKFGETLRRLGRSSGRRSRTCSRSSSYGDQRDAGGHRAETAGRGDEHHRPGRDVAAGHRLRRTAPPADHGADGLCGVVRSVSTRSSYVLAGVVQRSMFGLREEVERKLNQLPLSYIDRQPRGDLLSRVTNDIDNLSQSLQQTTSQILTSLLTLHRCDDHDVHDLAAPGADRPDHRAHLGAADEVHRRQGASTVHGAVASHRRPQRAGRRGVQRPRDRQELRAPA